MKKYEIVKKNTDFNDIINTGLCLMSRYYNIYYKDSNGDFPKFGIAVSKKIGCAVIRNKIKRQLRTIIDNNKKLFKKKVNYIIIVKKEIKNIDYKEMNDDLVKIMKG